MPPNNKTFLGESFSEAAKYNELNYPRELLHALSDTALLPDCVLTLKKEYSAILFSNLHTKNCCVNGMCYFVGTITNKVLFLRDATKNNKSSRLALLRIPFIPDVDNTPVSVFQRTQLLVCFCFVVEPNKGQNSSFSGAIEISLYHEYFTLVSLYVYESQVAHPSNNSVYSSGDGHSRTSVVCKSNFFY